MGYTAVFVPEFPVVALQRSLPELRGRACAVVEGTAPQETVFSLSQIAAKSGIERGMKKVQAETGGTTVFRPRDVEQEKKAFSSVLTVAEQFTPRVEAIASPHNDYASALGPAVLLLLDSAGIGTLYGSSEEYARRLHAALRQDGFPAHIGAAPNAEAALLLARSRQNVMCADQGSVRGSLARLPVALVSGEERALTVLRRWGIRTLGELAALPEAPLVSRLGQQGRRLQQLARGEADHLLVPEEEAFTLSETTALDEPLEVLDSLLFVVSPMLQNLLRRAMDRAYAIRSLALTLTLEQAVPHVLSVRPATPTQNREVLLKLLNLELQAHPPQAGIVGVLLEAEAAPPQTAQRGLFQAQFPEPDKLELLVARLRAIAGEGNVGSPVLQNVTGEDAFNLVPFAPSLYEQHSDQIAPCKIALRMLRPPQAARVTCWNDQPRALFWEGARHSITAAAGPWRSSGSWWSGDVWDHDLWDVVTSTPRYELRLQQDHASKAWAVVGLYD